MKLKSFITNIDASIAPELGYTYEPTRTNIQLNLVPLNQSSSNFADYTESPNGRNGAKIQIHSIEIIMSIICHPEWLRICLVIPKVAPDMPLTLSSNDSKAQLRFPKYYYTGTVDDTHWLLHDELRYVGGAMSPFGTNSTWQYGSTADTRTSAFKHRFKIPITTTFQDQLTGISPDYFTSKIINNPIHLSVQTVFGGINPGTSPAQVVGHARIWYSDN